MFLRWEQWVLWEETNVKVKGGKMELPGEKKPAIEKVNGQGFSR